MTDKTRKNPSWYFTHVSQEGLNSFVVLAVLLYRRRRVVAASPANANTITEPGSGTAGGAGAIDTKLKLDRLKSGLLF